MPSDLHNSTMAKSTDVIFIVWRCSPKITFWHTAVHAMQYLPVSSLVFHAFRINPCQQDLFQLIGRNLILLQFIRVEVLMILGIIVPYLFSLLLLLLCSAFLDLRKAFGSLDHHLLLKQLSGLGIGGVELQWFVDYLSNRKQRVKKRNQYSDWGAVLGGILCPWAFAFLSLCK